MEHQFPCERHDEKLLNLEKRIESIEKYDREDSQLLTELNVLIKEIAKTNESQSKALKDLSNSYIETGVTLSKINENLNGLNSKINDANKKIGELENKVNEQKIKNMKRFSWDFVSFIKSGIGILVAGGIIYYISTLIK